MIRRAKKRSPRRGVFFYTLAALSNLFMVAVASAVIAVLLILPGLPDIETIKSLQLKVPLRIYSDDGLLIGEFGDERRVPIEIEDAPPTLIVAVLAAEDDRYYRHVGIDYRGILRAMYANIVSGSRSQGASTITMQVARNFYLSTERTYLRKAREALLALRLEQHLTKDEILELYLNKIFLGHRAYGFGAAANVYYGKHLDKLGVPQYAMLAALPKAPSTINPINNPDTAKSRRDYILGRMHELGYINSEELASYIDTPLSAELHISEVELKAPYVAEQIRREMFERFGQAAYEEGYSVYSTIDSKYQQSAIRSLREGLIRYDLRHGYRGAVRNWDLAQLDTDQKIHDALKHVERSQEIVPVLVTEVLEDRITAVTKSGERIEIPWENMKWARRYRSARALGPEPTAPDEVAKAGDIVYARPNEESGWMLSQIPNVEGALISINPNNGAVLAMVGGFDFYRDKFNRATQGKRLLGSNIKPFVYSAALDNGFTSASLVSGAPIVVEDESSEIVWRPQNYSGEFTGDTRLRAALGRSLNLVSVRLIRGIGTDITIDHISKFGFDRDSLPEGLSLALGSAEATPLRVASSYAVFANGGYAVEPHFINLAKNQAEQVVFRGKTAQVCNSCLEPHQQPESDESAAVQPAVEQAQRVISSANAYIITDLMKSVIQHGTGRRARSLNRPDLAGKTGTTNDFEDAWFSGFSTDIVTTVWVGFDKPADLGRREHGSGLALPIWIDFMKTALQGQPEAPLLPPDNVVTASVDAETGEAVPEDAPNAIKEVFIAGTQPVLNIGHTSLEVQKPESDSGEKQPDNALF